MPHDPIPWERAHPLAHRLVEILTPFCARCCVAGSMRRHRPMVADIDLVILTEDRAQVAREMEKIADPILGGADADAQNLIYEINAGKLKGFQVDLFFARGDISDLAGITPGNWGTLFLCRTGSTQHNIAFAQRAKRLMMKWQPYEGVMDQMGRVIGSRTEEEVYEALGLPWLDPDARETVSF